MATQSRFLSFCSSDEHRSTGCTAYILMPNLTKMTPRYLDGTKDEQNQPA